MPGDLVDDGADLLLAEPLVVGVVVRAAHAAGGAELDHVRAVPQQPPHRHPHLVGGVGDLAQPRRGVEAAGQGEVRVAAGVPEQPHGGPDARADGQSRLHGRAVPGGQAAQVAHGGDARLQGAPHPLGGPEDLHRRIEPYSVAQVLGGLHAEVDVAVDEAGQHGPPGDVHDPVAGGRRGRPRRRTDVPQHAVRVRAHHPVGDGGGAGAVHDAGAGNPEGVAVVTGDSFSSRWGKATAAKRSGPRLHAGTCV